MDIGMGMNLLNIFCVVCHLNKEARSMHIDLLQLTHAVLSSLVGSIESNLGLF